LREAAQCNGVVDESWELENGLASGFLFKIHPLAIRMSTMSPETQNEGAFALLPRCWDQRWLEVVLEPLLASGQKEGENPSKLIALTSDPTAISDRTGAASLKRMQA